MELECYPVATRPPEIAPGRPERRWMDRFANRHPYRCLPLTMANTTGWELLCPVSFTAEWNGGEQNEDITLRPDRPHPAFHELAKAHFGGGVLTFHPGYLVRTPPGWDLIAQGPPNLPKDGIQPLSGLVETDWLPFPFTMNWIFTRPGRVLAVLHFSGVARDQNYRERTENLKRWAASRGISVKGEAVLAQYDPPWTLWFMRRNEVLLEVK